MCFSAEASFGASIVLGGVGILTIRKVQVRSQILFACIPFIFSFQQFSEGVLWLALHNKGFAFLQPIATYTFLIFAQIVWPTWVPLSILLLEKAVRRKNILYVILGFGILCSVSLTYCFIFYDVHSEINAHQS